MDVVFLLRWCVSGCGGCDVFVMVTVLCWLWYIVAVVIFLRR